MSANPNLVDAARVLLKWRKHIIVVTFLGAIGAVSFALFQPNVYSSTALIFPANLEQMDQANIFGLEPTQELQYFGGRDDVKRLLSLARSSEIQDHLINWFDLGNHYGYDTTSTLWRYKTKRRLDKNFEAVRNSEDVIEITVHDEDAEMAAALCNHVVRKLDERYTELMINRQKPKFFGVEAVLKVTEARVDSMKTFLTRFKDTTVLDYQVGAAELREATRQRSILRSKFNQFKGALSLKYSSIELVQPAMPALRKSKPVRSLIVLSMTLGIFFFAVVLALAIEKWREIHAAARLQTP